jgi:hypothetical protein
MSNFAWCSKIATGRKCVPISRFPSPSAGLHPGA